MLYVCKTLNLMRTLNVFALLFCVFLSVDASALSDRYPISGMVIDSQSHDGIPNASVTVLGDDDARVMTDSSGHFTLYIAPSEVCRFIAMHQKYSLKVTQEVKVTNCTPFLRIELERQLRRSSQNSINRLIRMADVMKKDNHDDSLYVTFYAEKLARLKTGADIRHGKLPMSFKSLRKKTEDRRFNDDNQQFILLRHRSSGIIKTEYATEGHSGRRQQSEAKRPARIRPLKKEEA